MKKQLMTIAILTIILVSCQKENSELSDLKSKELKTNSIAPPPGTITLQAVILHSKIDISFGWENNGGFQDHSIKSSLNTSGGGCCASWQQNQAFSSGDPSNPDKVNIIIVGTYTYLVTGRFGADKVKEAVFIQICYNVKTGVYTTVVSRTNATITR